jgi:hypothetical protein
MPPVLAKARTLVVQDTKKPAVEQPAKNQNWGCSDELKWWDLIG